MSPFKIILNAIMSFKHGQEIVKFKAKKTLLFSHIGHCSCGINPIFLGGGLYSRTSILIGGGDCPVLLPGLTPLHCSTGTAAVTGILGSWNCARAPVVVE